MDIERQILTRIGEEKCDIAKRMIQIGDIPAARAALEAALKNLDLLEGLQPATPNQKAIEA